MKRENIKRFNESKKLASFDTSYLLYEEAEPIEIKVARIVENNEPITDGAPLVYTKRSDGVKPEYDIRTDKWDIAQENMRKVAESKKNKIKENMSKGLAGKQPTEQPTEQPKENS